MLKINLKKKYIILSFIEEFLCQQQFFFYNMLAQTIKKNIHMPYDVLRIIFGVTIY